MAEPIRHEGAWPFWLCVAGGLFIFAPLLDGGTTHLAVMVIRLLILVLVGCYFWQSVSSGALACPPVRIGLPVLAFLGLAGVSAILSPYTDQSLQWLVVLCGYAGLLALLVCFIAGWDHVAKLTAVVAATGLVEAVYALVQGWWTGMIRPRGTFFNPNFLAGYLAAVWAVIFGWLAYTGPGRVGWLPGRPWLTRFLLARGLPGIWLAGLFLAVIWTGSRGGLLALSAGIAVVIGIRYGRAVLTTVLAGLLCLALVTPNPFRDRMWAEHQINPETYARWEIWKRSVLEMADHPLGIGLGLYQYWAPRYMFPVEGQILRYGKIAQTAHNEYLQMGVELGVVSLPVFGWGLWVLGREAALVLKQRLRRWQRGLVVGIVAGIVSLLVHAGVDSTWHEPALALLLTLLVALLLALRRCAPRRPQPTPALPIGSRPIWAILGLAVVLALGWEVLRLGLAWQAFERGSAAAVRQDFALALSGYRTAVSLDPGKALYHSSLASGQFQLFQRTGDLGAAQAAISELEVAATLNPLDGRLMALQGHVYETVALSGVPPLSSEGHRLSLLHAARASYERAIALEPFAPFYRLEVGRLSLALGERVVAEAWVRGALELEPNFLPGREWLARLYLASGRSGAATQEVVEIRERQQRYAAWSKDPQEARFLRADVTALEAVLDHAAPPA